ncbi:MAG TPA: dephospho-CoA kinase [Pyrinomonadaceae bacterium]|jgi:dephospho-CoA kinase|nr:dephospho-CoA kinase [Pyrinomonadaceae bacterium]
MMLKVGLTGSIAVGKSFVCDVLREMGVHVLDADQTARDVVAPGTEGLADIATVFGTEVLKPDGSLDRGKMASIVFADEAQRKLLNSIVHPLVIEEQDNWISACETDDPGGIAVIDATLMIESGGYRRFDKLIVVWCEAGLQLARLIARSGLDEDEAKKRIAAQMPQDEKKRYADFLIDTSNGFDDTRRQTLELVNELRSLSTADATPRETTDR